MSEIFRNHPINNNPQIVITAYTVENELIFEPVKNHPESKHTHKYQYLETYPDVKVARNKAFRKVLEEAHDLLATCHLMSHPSQPYLGLKLYAEYHSLNKNETELEPKVQRFYILDGEQFDRKILLERLADELFLLMRAGAEFDSTILKDDDGTEYEIVDCDLPEIIKNDSK